MAGTFLITGGAGFIGSHLAEALQERGEVRVLDNLRSGYRHNLEGIRHTFVEGSVEDPVILDKVMQGVDFVFHLAALISVPESMEKPLETVAINTAGTLNVLEAARRHGVVKVLFASSAAVYGNDPHMPKREDMLPQPLSPYAVTKLDGEYYCCMYNREGWVRSAVLRFFNVFGPRQDPASKYAAAVPIFINQALTGKDITIFGDGEQTRDFVYVKDVVNALLLLMEKGDGEVFNLSGGGVVSINELACFINDLCGSRSTIVYLPERSGDIKHSAASIKKLQSLGFSISHERNEAVRTTHAYYASRQDSGSV